MEQTQKEHLDWTTNLTGEMLLFSLLAKLVYSDPDAAWLQSLMDGEVFSEVPLGSEEPETRLGLEAINRWMQDQHGKLSAETVIGLKGEYISLFVGPGKMDAPVWESVYFSDEHLVFQEQTLSVRYWYRRFGLEVEHVNREPDDHIAFEVSFIAHLAGLALKALEENNSARFESLLRAQKDFLSNHLLLWGLRWSNLVVQYAQTDFYRGLGHLVSGSLRSAAKLLELEIPKKALK